MEIFRLLNLAILTLASVGIASSTSECIGSICNTFEFNVPLTVSHKRLHRTQWQLKRDVNGLDSFGTRSSDNAVGGMGICYDMQSTICKQPAQIQQDFSFLKWQGYSVIRLYDIGCNISDFVTAANANGLQLMIGLNNPGANGGLQHQLSILIGMVGPRWNTIHTVYLGNELVDQGITDSPTVQGYVSTGRAQLLSAGYTGSVVAVDTFAAIEKDPSICSTSDYCAADAHAFFDPDMLPANAGSFVLNAYNSVKAKVNKNVVIAESGWPWKGGCNSQACSSPVDQVAAINSIMTAFKNIPGSIFIFQAYDTPYKSPGPLGVEQNWGVYDSYHFANNIGPS